MKNRKFRKIITLSILLSLLTSCRSEPQSKSSPKQPQLSTTQTEPASDVESATSTNRKNLTNGPKPAAQKVELTPKQIEILNRQLLGIIEGLNRKVEPLNPVELAFATQQMYDSLRGFQALQVDPSAHRNCQVFFRSANTIAAALIQTSSELQVRASGPDQMYRMARVRVLAGQLALFYAIAKGGQASGANVLGLGEEVGCFGTKAHHEQAMKSFEAAKRDVIRYIDGLMGVDPIEVSGFLSQVENANIEKHQAESRQGVYYFAGTIVASFVLWKFMLARAAALAGSLAVKAVVVEVPMKLLLGASEIVAALYIDRNFVTRETTWLEDRGDKSGFSIGSQAEWDSLMKQVEEFQSSSLESPIQYAQFLWSEHKARLDKYESLLLRFKPVLDRMERQYGSIENAARKLREQQESLNEKPNL